MPITDLEIKSKISMDTDQMDYVLKIEETLSFNRAAKALGISQPTLTYQVKLLEKEIGFAIFDRSGRTVSMTPAGRQFCQSLSSIRQEIKAAVEMGQNLDGRYRESITVGLTDIGELHLLPQAMRMFAEDFPDISVSVLFSDFYDHRAFLNGDADIEFAFGRDAESLPDTEAVHLYTSGIYLFCLPDDPLAKKDMVREEDLRGRTLMVGGPSPPELVRVQRRLIDSGAVQWMNSEDPDTTRINLLSGKGIALAPGFLNDRNPRYAWVPFDCPERFDCVLCVKKQRPWTVDRFVQMLVSMYSSCRDPL